MVLPALLEATLSSLGVTRMVLPLVARRVPLSSHQRDNTHWRRKEPLIRILLIGLNYAPERAGIAPYTTALAERLSGLGHQVRVLTTFPHYPEWRFTGATTQRRHEERLHGVDVIRLRHRLPRANSSVSRLISEISFGLHTLSCSWGRPEAVVLVSPAMFSASLASLRSRLSRAGRTIVWVQDLYSSGVEETGAGDSFGFALRIVQGVERRLLRRADQVVLIHERMREEVVSMGVDHARAHVMRNWSHVPTPRPSDRMQVRRRLGWGSDETIVLHTGNMGTKQALFNVLRAAEIADTSQTHIRFVLMGDGNMRSALEAGAVGIQRVQIVDSVPTSEYLDVLRAADILLVNEHRDLRTTALPSKLTSYFSSGRPVLVATSADSLTADEAERAAAGVRVEPDDPEALLDAAQRLAADEPLMRRLGENGRRYQQTYLTEDAAVRTFDGVVLSSSERYRNATLPEPRFPGSAGGAPAGPSPDADEREESQSSS